MTLLALETAFGPFLDALPHGRELLRGLEDLVQARGPRAARAALRSVVGCLGLPPREEPLPGSLEAAHLGHIGTVEVVHAAVAHALAGPVHLRAARALAPDGLVVLTSAGPRLEFLWHGSAEPRRLVVRGPFAASRAEDHLAILARRLHLLARTGDPEAALLTPAAAIARGWEGAPGAIEQGVPFAASAAWAHAAFLEPGPFFGLSRVLGCAFPLHAGIFSRAHVLCDGHEVHPASGPALALRRGDTWSREITLHLRVRLRGGAELPLALPASVPDCTPDGHLVLEGRWLRFTPTLLPADHRDAGLTLAAVLERAVAFRMRQVRRIARNLDEQGEELVRALLAGLRWVSPRPGPFELAHPAVLRRLLAASGPPDAFGMRVRVPGLLAPPPPFACLLAGVDLPAGEALPVQAARLAPDGTPAVPVPGPEGPRLAAPDATAFERELAGDPATFIAPALAGVPEVASVSAGVLARRLVRVELPAGVRRPGPVLRATVPDLPMPVERLVIELPAGTGAEPLVGAGEHVDAGEPWLAIAGSPRRPVPAPLHALAAEVTGATRANEERLRVPPGLSGTVRHAEVHAVHDRSGFATSARAVLEVETDRPGWLVLEDGRLAPVTCGDELAIEDPRAIGAATIPPARALWLPGAPRVDGPDRHLARRVRDGEGIPAHRAAPGLEAQGWIRWCARDPEGAARVAAAARALTGAAPSRPALEALRQVLEPRGTGEALEWIETKLGRGQARGQQRSGAIWSCACGRVQGDDRAFVPCWPDRLGTGGGCGTVVLPRPGPDGPLPRLELPEPALHPYHRGELGAVLGLDDAALLDAYATRGGAAILAQISDRRLLLESVPVLPAFLHPTGEVRTGGGLARSPITSRYVAIDAARRRLASLPPHTPGIAIAGLRLALQRAVDALYGDPAAPASGEPTDLAALVARVSPLSRPARLRSSPPGLVALVDARPGEEAGVVIEVTDPLALARALPPLPPMELPEHVDVRVPAPRRLSCVFCGKKVRRARPDGSCPSCELPGVVEVAGEAEPSRRRPPGEADPQILALLDATPVPPRTLEVDLETAPGEKHVAVALPDGLVVAPPPPPRTVPRTPAEHRAQAARELADGLLGFFTAVLAPLHAVEGGGDVLGGRAIGVAAVIDAGLSVAGPPPWPVGWLALTELANAAAGADADPSTLVAWLTGEEPTPLATPALPAVLAALEAGFPGPGPRLALARRLLARVLAGFAADGSSWSPPLSGGDRAIFPLRHPAWRALPAADAALAPALWLARDEPAGAVALVLGEEVVVPRWA